MGNENCSTKVVLVVEDELTSQKLVKNVTQSLGRPSVIARNGRIAWELLQDNPDIGIVVSDVSMPEMDGRELVTRIRSSENLKHIPIILMSGVVKLSEINDLLELGVSRFMPKPISITDLRGYIEQLLK